MQWLDINIFLLSGTPEATILRAGFLFHSIALEYKVGLLLFESEMSLIDSFDPGSTIWRCSSNVRRPLNSWNLRVCF